MDISIKKHPVLTHCYEHVTSLYDYLYRCLDEQLNSQLIQEATDSHLYVTLLQRTQVAWNGHDGPFLRTAETSHTPFMTWSEVIRRAQGDILSADSRPDNVLCFGYTLVCNNRVFLLGGC